MHFFPTSFHSPLCCYRRIRLVITNESHLYTLPNLSSLNNCWRKISSQEVEVIALYSTFALDLITTLCFLAGLGLMIGIGFKSQCVYELQTFVHVGLEWHPSFIHAQLGHLSLASCNMSYFYLSCSSYHASRVN